jgi:hypothetical protein
MMNILLHSIENRKYLNRMKSITCILLTILTFGLNGLKQALFVAQYQAVESSDSQYLFIEQTKYM